MAYKDGGEVGTLAAGGDDALYFLLDFCLDGGSGGFSVDEGHYSLKFKV